MVETFPALLARLLARDPGRPLVTFYDDATGERVELSVATYANWVAKTSSLLVEELDLERGRRLAVDLPTHWLGPVFLGAAWSVGLVVLLDGAGDADAVVCGPDRLTSYGDRAASVPVLATALLPLGARFPDGTPDGVLDFGAEVWSQPDAFVPWDPPAPDDEALPGTAQSVLLAPSGEDPWPLVPEGGRLLTAANPASPAGLAAFVAPLVRGGSTVWVRHADPTSWDRKVDAERATVTWAPPAGDQPARS